MPEMTSKRSFFKADCHVASEKSAREMRYPFEILRGKTRLKNRGPIISFQFPAGAEFLALKQESRILGHSFDCGHSTSMRSLPSDIYKTLWSRINWDMSWSGTNVLCSGVFRPLKRRGDCFHNTWGGEEDKQGCHQRWNGVASSLNRIQSWTTVRDSYSRAFEQGSLVVIASALPPYKNQKVKSQNIGVKRSDNQPQNVPNSIGFTVQCAPIARSRSMFVQWNLTSRMTV